MTYLQKKIMNQVLNDLSAIYIDSWLLAMDRNEFREGIDDEDLDIEWHLEDYTTVRFTYTCRIKNYNLNWLVKQFHWDEMDSWVDKNYSLYSW